MDLAIGNYIHARYDNYIKYGIGQKENIEVGKGQKALSDQRRKCTNMANKYKKQGQKDTAEKIGILMTNLIYGNHPDDSEDKKIHDELYSVINERVKKELGSFGLDKYYHVHNIIPAGVKNKKLVYKSTLEKLISFLQNLEGTTKRIEELKSYGDQLERIINEINQTEGSTGKIFARLYDENNKDLAVLLNNIYTKLNVPDIKAIGKVLEIVFDSVQIVGEKVIVKEIGDIIEKGFTAGDQTGTTGYSLDFFSKDIQDLLIDQIPHKNKETGNHSGALNDDGATYDIVTSENLSAGKVDVNFKYNDDTLNMSLKNYSLKNKSQNIHIVSDSPMLYLIQNEKASFVNHYLNIVAHNRNNERWAERKDSRAGIEDVTKWHQVMKLTLFIKGLSGHGIYGREKSSADYFVVNNRSKRRINIWPMGEVMTAAQRDVEALVFKGYPSTETFVKGNKWVGEQRPDVGDAMIRRANLLGILHQAKISIEIPQSVLY